MVTNAESLAQFDNIRAQLSPKTELIVLFFFDPLDELCKRMEGNLGWWSKQDKYRDRVLFIKCAEESANDIFEKYNVKPVPTFLFFKNNGQVEQVEEVPRLSTESNLRRTTIEDVMDGLLTNKK